MIKLKDIIKESKWSDRNWGDPLPTLEDYIVEFKKNLKPTDGSKEVTFTNKDNYDDAVKSGDYEDPEDKGGDKKSDAGKLGGGDYERDFEDDPDDIDNLDTALDGSEPEDKPFGGDTGADADSGQPIPAKDLANDPSADTGPDSRGTSWSGDYYGAEDSAEWEDQYKEAEEDGDEEELAQIKWFGEKQGWGDNGEMPKGESIHPLKKMFNRIGG